MLKKELGSLKRLEAREVWTNEALDFTPWLRDNVQLLSAAIGMDLDLVESEVAVGPFSADLVAKDPSSGRTIVIENQLESTDHGHLGQVLTYGAGTSASVFVWISTQFRDEHRAALDWLNEHSALGFDFFGVEVEVIEIDGSRPAVNFKLVSSPNDWPPKPAPMPSAKRQAYAKFWGGLLTAFKSAYPGETNTSSAGSDSWLALSIGKSGVATGWAFAGDKRFRVEIYISTGDRGTNKAYFDQLLRSQEQIEAQLGYRLEWDRIDAKQDCRISAYYNANVTVNDGEELLDALSSWAVVEMKRVRDAFRPFVKGLVLSDSGAASASADVDRESAGS